MFEEIEEKETYTFLPNREQEGRRKSYNQTVEKFWWYPMECGRNQSSKAIGDDCVMNCIKSENQPLKALYNNWTISQQNKVIQKLRVKNFAQNLFF